MSTARSLLRGSFFRTAELFVMLGATFMVTPMLVHSLGDRLYAFWTLAGAFVGYYGLLDLGLTSAAARYLSQALGRGDEEELDAVANTAFFLFTGVALALGLATVGSAWACPRFMKDPAEAELFRRLILILGASAAVSVPAKLYQGMLAADISYDVVAGVSIARTLAWGAGVYALLSAGGGILSVAALSSGVSLLQCAAYYVACRLRFPAVRIRLRRCDPAAIKMMLGYGWKTFVCQLGDILRFRLDTVVIASFLSAALVTPYSVGSRVVEGMCQLVLSSVGMMLPVFSRYEGRGDYDSIRRALLTITKFSTVLSTFVGLSVMFYARAFIARWMGPGFDSGAAAGVAAVLCAGYMISLPQSPGVQLLYGVSQHHIYAALSIGEGLLNLGLSVYFLRRWGIYGVAFGTAASMAVFKLFLQPYYVCRAAGLSARVYLGETVFLTFLKTAVPLGLFFIAARPMLVPSWKGLALCVSTQTVVLAPVLYLFVLSGAERRALAEALWGFARPKAPALEVSPE